MPHICTDCVADCLCNLFYGLFLAALQGERCPCQERQCFLTRARGRARVGGVSGFMSALRKCRGLGHIYFGIYVGAAQVPGFGFKPYLTQCLACRSAFVRQPATGAVVCSKCPYEGSLKWSRGTFATVTYTGVRINFISHDNFNLGFETVGPSRIKQVNEDSRPCVSRLRFPVADRRGLAARLRQVLRCSESSNKLKSLW